MKTRNLSIAEIAVIGATRGLAGAGLGLLLADRLTSRHRKTIGWTLFLVGAISTVPIMRHLLGKAPCEIEEANVEHEEEPAMH